jgi:ADP-ribosylglycohydrolase
MLGAIAGDIIGSRFERSPIKTKDFPLFTAQNHFTDDTVLTVAVAEAILTAGLIPAYPAPLRQPVSARRLWGLVSRLADTT